MIIKIANKEQLKGVAKLSEMFANENCCNGIVPDSEEHYLDIIVAVAVNDNEIIGYAYGEFETSKKNKSYVLKGEKIFYLAEMYSQKKEIWTVDFYFQFKTENLKNILTFSISMI